MSSSVLLVFPLLCVLFFFFFNDTATTEIYTLSLHDALPIYWAPEPAVSSLLRQGQWPSSLVPWRSYASPNRINRCKPSRSEEHTSELQSRLHLVCRLLLEKKKRETRPAERSRLYAHQAVGTI